jgi:hypothetical protein
MSFTSHIFISLPLVHTLNPDFLRWQLWLCFLLVRESPRSRKPHALWLPNSSSITFPNSTDSRSSWLYRFMALSLHEFATSGLSRFEIPSHCTFATPRLREFGTQTTAHSRLLDFMSSLPLKTCITNFINLDVSRVTSFHEFPNTRLTNEGNAVRIKTRED